MEIKIRRLVVYETLKLTGRGTQKDSISFLEYSCHSLSAGFQDPL